MNIVYTLNDKFVPQVAAGICSICENNQTENITFYLISDRISKKHQQQLKKFVAGYGQKLQIVEIGDVKQYFEFEFDTTGWNPIVLTRLVLDKLLPNNVDRILYLDGDTIVRDSLAELYHTDMGKSVIGASIEPTADQARKQTLHLQGAYYNAGVLLIDMYKWRQEKTGQKILNYYAAHNGKLFANDQDAINGALKNEIYTLAPKYNFCNIYYQYPYKFLQKLVKPATYFSELDFADSVQNPVIIHYLGEERPWRAGNTHRYRDDYKYYLSKTPWKDTPDEAGWQTYFIFWNLFNTLTRPFPNLRYQIITSLIPFVLQQRAKQNRQTSHGGGQHNEAQSGTFVVHSHGKTPNSPKVSILIPAYNAEKLVHKAIDSALAQTHSNIEIIIINDGSTDDTWHILQEYQQKYPQKITIFSQKNKGLGATRNLLLKKATGDYIINLDSDDWLKPDYAEVMLSALGTGDIAICGFERYDAQYQFRDQRIPDLTSYSKYRFCTTAGKIFRHEFLRAIKLKYESINMGEDAAFNILAYAKTNAIAILVYGGYCCYESAHSMAHTAHYEKDKSFYMLMNHLEDRLKNSDILHESEFQFYVFKNLLMDVFIYKDNLSARELVKIYRTSVKWYQEFLHQNHAQFHLRFQKGETIMINLTINGFIIMTKLHLEGIMLPILKKIPINIL